MNISAGYYKCSNNCDFFYVVGGDGACQLPMSQAKCPWCKGGIGGLDHKLDGVSKGAKMYTLQGGIAELSAVR